MSELDWKHTPLCEGQGSLGHIEIILHGRETLCILRSTLNTVKVNIAK